MVCGQVLRAPVEIFWIERTTRVAAHSADPRAAALVNLAFRFVVAVWPWRLLAGFAQYGNGSVGLAPHSVSFVPKLTPFVDGRYSLSL